VDGEIKDLVPKMQLDRYKIHDIEVVVDRLAVTDDMKLRLSQSVQKALQVGKDLLFVAPASSPTAGKNLKNIDSKSISAVQTGSGNSKKGKQTTLQN
jgi:excinuclease ABC subunit A